MKTLKFILIALILMLTFHVYFLPVLAYEYDDVVFDMPDLGETSRSYSFSGSSFILNYINTSNGDTGSYNPSNPFGVTEKNVIGIFVQYITEDNKGRRFSGGSLVIVGDSLSNLRNSYSYNGVTYKINGMGLRSSNLKVQSFVCDLNSPSIFITAVNASTSDYSWLPWVTIEKYFNTGVLDGDIRENDQSIDGSSLGYLSDVQYYVDSAAYLYDPENTPEYVKWGSTSTTGIDLTDPRYYVEFICEDKSTFLRHNSKDSYVAESGMPFSNAITYTASRYEYFSQYIFPKGSDERALMSGRAGKTSLYGSASSLGTVAASARQYKFSAAAQYKKALANDSDSDKSLIYQFVDGITTFNFTPQQWLFNHYDQSGKALNWSYDLYARIVDTQAGVGGDWLKIDRHNSPWEMSNDDRFLNGGVTVSEGHKFVNYKPTDVFVKLPENTGDTIIDKSIETGYVLNGDFQPTYNNQTYNYYVNNTTNNNDNSTTNNYFQNPNTNVEDDHNSIIDAIDILKSLGALSSLFLLLFSPLLPAWAVGFVGVAVTCIIAMVVWRVIKGVLPW